MKEKIRTFAQSCDSRKCRKKHKDELSEICDAVTTVHTFNVVTKEVTCTECGKTYKLPKD
jgi:hypothetical protein